MLLRIGAFRLDFGVILLLLGTFVITNFYISTTLRWVFLCDGFCTAINSSGAEGSAAVRSGGMFLEGLRIGLLLLYLDFKLLLYKILLVLFSLDFLDGTSTMSMSASQFQGRTERW